MTTKGLDYKALCEKLLQAESEDAVTQILNSHGLLDPSHWKPLGNMPNNRSMVDNQAADPAGAQVEKIVNSIDAVLTKECLLKKISPSSPAAPQTMLAAAEKFFGIKEGNLANITAKELTRLAENIQIIVTGTKPNPCYIIIDKGEGQTALRFEDTFLSLTKSNKGSIPFVQGKFNCGGTGVLPFCGSHGYELIISRRHPDIPSDPSVPNLNDSTHAFWGFTIIRDLPASAKIYNTKTYVYLAPGGAIPFFDEKEVLAIPEVGKESIGAEGETEGETEGPASHKKDMPQPYKVGLQHGTIVKLYNYQWPARSIATREVRYELERYLYKLCLPLRIVETRAGFHANYFATTVSGTAVTISKDQEKNFLEDNFPQGGELRREGIGAFPITVALYRERKNQEDKSAKSSKRLPKGLYFTINGQVHFQVGPEFFVTRGLNYEFLKNTLLVTVDCSGINEDVRDRLVMPSRDRLRKLAEFELILDTIVADLKDRTSLRAINDARKLQRVKEALTTDAVQDVLQSLINKNPVFASLFNNGKGLRLPTAPTSAPGPAFKGKFPPTFFHFGNEKTETNKSFPIDRTCAVELETDAINDYFELPDPKDRGELQIEPAYQESRKLSEGKLRIVFRAPSNGKIGDTAKVTITITDPCTKKQWVNHVNLTFTVGGKEAKPGTRPPAPPKNQKNGALGMPKFVLVYKAQWEDPAYNFDEHSALKISKNDDESYIFFINMDNVYLHNELLHRKDDKKEEAKFAFQWGLVLVALGVLEELKAKKKDAEEGAATPSLSIEEQVGLFSAGVARVIIPTVINLMETMSTMETKPG